MHGNRLSEPSPKSSLAEFVRELRVARGLTQRELDTLCSFPGHFTSHIESGETKYLSEDRIDALRRVLHCKACELRARSCSMLEKERKMIKTDLGRLLFELRTAKGLSVDDVAKKTGVKPMTVRMLETRKERGMKFETAARYASVFEAPISLFEPYMVAVKKPRDGAGKLIEQARRERGLTMRDLGVMIGVTKQSIRRIELGKTPLSRNLGRARDIAQALGLRIEDLIS